MVSSGTYSFNPAISNLVRQAYSRIGIRGPQLAAEHMLDAYNEANLVQVELSNRIPNLWLDELYEQELDEGVATYTLNPRLVAFQAPVISTDTAGVTIDRLIYPYSTFEYAAIPNKEQQGPPTCYWLNMLETPEVTFWPVPDGNATYTLKVRQLRQIQDADLKNGVTADIPYRWLDVYVAKLAHRFARIYARDQEPLRRQDAEEAWAIAATTDKEQVPTYIMPQTFGYYG